MASSTGARGVVWPFAPSRSRITSDFDTRRWRDSAAMSAASDSGSRTVRVFISPPAYYRCAVAAIRRLLRGVGDVLLALQPLIHPADDVLEALDAMPGLARAGQLVGLAREADHHRRDLPIFERAEHHLAAVGRRRAIVPVAVDQHQRRRDVGDVRDRRARGEVLGIFPRCLLEPGWLEEREIGGEPEAVPIGDVALRDRRLEALGLRDRPVGEETAAAAAGDPEAAGVDVAFLEDFIDSCHQILVVVARITVLDDVAELLPV